MTRGQQTMTAAEYRQRHGLDPAGDDRAPKRRRRQPETILHLAVIDWLRDIEFGGVPPLYTHPANERRSRMESIRAWRMGQLSGAPDLLFWLAGGRSLAVELKAPSGSLSRAQREVHAQLAMLGHRVVVCRSIDDVARALSEAGVEYAETVSSRLIRESRP